MNIFLLGLSKLFTEKIAQKFIVFPSVDYLKSIHLLETVSVDRPKKKEEMFSFTHSSQIESAAVDCLRLFGERSKTSGKMKDIVCWREVSLSGSSLPLEAFLVLKRIISHKRKRKGKRREK